jgi:anthranilate 3-monooxygenase (FAD)/4-hydroxyphenylacetate 3-monooxygenase
MIATLGAVSDEMIICNPPMFKPGDEDHALMFAVPTDVPGLRQICREPCNMGERASFDHPLASRFAEIDSLLIFKDVFVPWDRVFCYRDIGLSNAIYPECGLRNHTAHQTDARALVKLQFAAGLAVAVARAIKADRFPHVQQMLGEALGYVEMVKSALVRSEAECEPTPAGTMRPALAPLQALATFLPTAYPRVIEILRTIAAERLTMMPSGADLACDELAQDAALYCQGADGLFRLARDLAGDAFGSRLPHDAGDSAGNYLGCDDREMMRLVRAALDLAGDPSQ